MLIILHQIDRHHSVAYVPYGPELEPANELEGVFLEELSESLRSYLPQNCIVIRYDLCWESYLAADALLCHALQVVSVREKIKNPCW